MMERLLPELAVFSQESHCPSRNKDFFGPSDRSRAETTMSWPHRYQDWLAVHTSCLPFKAEAPASALKMDLGSLSPSICSFSLGNHTKWISSHYTVMWASNWHVESWWLSSACWDCHSLGVDPKTSGHSILGKCQHPWRTWELLQRITRNVCVVSRFLGSLESPAR